MVCQCGCRVARRAAGAHSAESFPPAKFEFLFDASPWGLGGVLVHTATGQPLQFFAEAVQPEDEVMLQLSVGSSAGQAKLETLAIVLGMRLWAPLLRECGA